MRLFSDEWRRSGRGARDTLGVRWGTTKLAEFKPLAFQNKAWWIFTTTQLLWSRCGVSLSVPEGRWISLSMLSGEDTPMDVQQKLMRHAQISSARLLSQLRTPANLLRATPNTQPSVPTASKPQNTPPQTSRRN